MNGKIRFGSVCSGIEAASVAWHPLGWEAAWLSEIEPFPCAVLKHHYPQVPNLGDMTLLPNRIASGEIEAPDVFCGGTPCQAFSVAGLRQSLDDSRGNLSLIFCEIANAIDNIRLIQQSSPAIIFWENVPGVLNTKDNAFGCFLAGLAGESDALIPSGGRWTDAGFIDGPKRAVAWRVLDAQYFGLAQRRKRVFVVASARDDFDPAEVLFEFDGVRRDIAPSGKKREKTSNGLENIVGALCARDYKGLSADNVSEGKAIVQEVYENHPADSRVKEMGDTCATVTSRWGTGGGNVPLVQAFDSYNLSLSDVNQTIKSPSGGTLESVGGIVQQAFRKSRRAQSVDDFETWVDDGLANTLNTFDLGDIRTTHAVAYSVREDAKANTFSATELDVANSIGALQPSPQSHHAQVFVAQAVDTYNGTIQGDVTATMTADMAGPTHSGPKVMQSNMAVRRLTPKECERLQGFPDGYTDIRPKGKDTPDGSRYKALGNSWAVPVVAWIGKRINHAIT